MVIESTTRRSSEVEVTAADLFLGIALAAPRLADRMASATFRLFAERVPFARQLPAPGALVKGWPALDGVLRRIAEEGHQQRIAVMNALEREVRAQVPRVVEAMLDELDLTEIVKNRVDLDAVAREIDVDAVAARLDLAALIDRIDLIGLARYVIEGVDLPEIVRDSTGSMASEGVRTVRMQTINADERVSRVVDRLLPRRRVRAAAVTAEPDAAPGDDGGAR